MDQIQKLVDTLFSEYGGLVTFLAVTDAALVYFIYNLWKHNVSLADKLLSFIQESVKVLTKLEEKIENVDKKN
jgi:zinc transporter ZupT